MSSFLRLSMALVLLVGLARPALAEWVVAKVSQPARYAVDGRTWRLVTQGMEVPNNAWIHTGRRGRVILRQAGNAIQFKPNTVAAISEREDGGSSETTVIQKFGSILLDIDPERRGGAAVQTPFLAAIVKGTRLDVEVRTDGGTLRVADGVVEVTDLIQGLRVLARPRQRVTVDGEEGRSPSVRGPGPRAAIVAVTPTAPRVSAARPANPGRRAGHDPSAFLGRRQEENDEAWRGRMERTLERQEADDVKQVRPKPGAPPTAPGGGGEPPAPADGGGAPQGPGNEPPARPGDDRGPPMPPQAGGGGPVSGN